MPKRQRRNLSQGESMMNSFLKKPQRNFVKKSETAGRLTEKTRALIKYLLDTNICIFGNKKKFDIEKKFDEVGISNCFISEIVFAELKFGVENSNDIIKNQKALVDFLSGIKIIPIFDVIDFYAKEKARLRKLGITIEEFDLLIGCTSVTQNLIMVTNNTEHFKRIKGIHLEDWTK